MLALELLWFKESIQRIPILRISDLRIRTCELRIAKIRVVRYVAGKIFRWRAASADPAGAPLYQAFSSAAHLPVLDLSPLSSSAPASADSGTTQIYGRFVRG